MYRFPAKASLAEPFKEYLLALFLICSDVCVQNDFTNLILSEKEEPFHSVANSRSKPSLPLQTEKLKLFSLLLSRTTISDCACRSTIVFCDQQNNHAGPYHPAAHANTVDGATSEANPPCINWKSIAASRPF